MKWLMAVVKEIPAYMEGHVSFLRKVAILAVVQRDIGGEGKTVLSMLLLSF